MLDHKISHSLIELRDIRLVLQANDVDVGYGQQVVTLGLDAIDRCVFGTPALPANSAQAGGGQHISLSNTNKQARQTPVRKQCGTMGMTVT